MTDEELKRIEERCDHNDKENYMESCWDLTGDARALIREVRRLRGDLAAAEDGIDAAWGVIANAFGGSWDSADPAWKEAAELWRDQHFHAAIDRAERNRVATQPTAPSAPAHCWEGNGESTCMLPDGHKGPHDFVPDSRIAVSFAPSAPLRCPTCGHTISAGAKQCDRCAPGAK